MSPEQGNPPLAPAPALDKHARLSSRGAEPGLTGLSAATQRADEPQQEPVHGWLRRRQASRAYIEAAIEYGKLKCERESDIELRIATFSVISEEVLNGQEHRLRSLPRRLASWDRAYSELQDLDDQRFNQAGQQRDLRERAHVLPAGARCAVILFDLDEARRLELAGVRVFWITAELVGERPIGELVECERRPGPLAGAYQGQAKFERRHDGELVPVGGVGYWLAREAGGEALFA